jgi:methyl-accepting chemotaxis protein
LEFDVFNVFGRTANGIAAATLSALSKSQAVIEFDLSGNILTANENFLNALGYTLPEIQGQNHSMFVEPGYRASAEYKTFWDDLHAGRHQAKQFKRIGKGGREVWIEATYNPILNRSGKPFKVVKFATDVTAQKIEYANLRGEVDAISKSQAVIEFGLDGKVLTANQNFLGLLGYTLAEIKGQHHRMFVEPSYRESPEYRAFWQKLNQGEFQAAQFKRITKSGKEVWIEASYNPILDLDGRPCKVVKFATDITAQVTLLGNLKTMIDRNFGEIDTALATSSQQAELAIGASGLTATRVQSMAASTEELAASVREIADTMSKSRTATDTAHAQTGAANLATGRLATTSQSMGGIVQLIRSIAGQINLLALNATIESARAGEAGKGFAVVASEVKSLARQASDATDQIATEIDKLQTVSGEVVGALAQIGASIDIVRTFVTGTAGAVEEQSVVTQEMSAGMQQTATSVSAMNDNVTGIAAAVHQVAHAVASTKDAARVLVR